jgi:hypothetical protein
MEEIIKITARIRCILIAHCGSFDWFEIFIIESEVIYCGILPAFSFRDKS